MTWRSVAAMALLVVSGTASHALEGASVAGFITATDPPGTPIAGAIVVASQGDERVAAVTNAIGAYELTGLDTGEHRLVAQAPGYAVGTVAELAVSGAGATQDLALTPSGGLFDTLGVFGGQIASLASGGQSGVFYASTSVIPQVFRTVDYGGTWTPVTPASDDPAAGLVGTNASSGLATSFYAGDVAVEVNGVVYYSIDFGVTWQAIGNPGGSPFGGGPGAQLLWGHSDQTNVLLRISGTTTYRADMSAPSPAFAEQTPSYLASAGDRIAVTAVSDEAWVAVVSAAGTLNVYDLSDATVSTSVSTLSGLPSPPTLVRFGGLPFEAQMPPDAILVYASGTDTAVMATKEGGTAFTSVSASTSVPMGCGQGPGSVGAITPTSSGTTGNGTIAQCFVTKSGTDPLTFTTIPGINNNTGLAFDSFYGVTNFVALSGDGYRGIVKSASQSSGVPVFPIGADAAPGGGLTTGGVAINGLTVPVVKDTAFGPSATQIAIALSGSGGGRAVASEDGGDTFVPVVTKGGNALDWWQGSSNAWLIVGHGGAGTLVTATADWTSSTPTWPGANVPGLDAAGLGATGMAEQFAITAIEGVAGADVVFIGGGSNVDQAGTGGTVFRGVLTGTGPVTVTNGTVLSDPLIGPRAVRALAHCARIGDDDDVLFVATANDTTGTVVRVVGASGTTPVMTEVFSGTRANDVRAHCTSGAVYLGTGANSGGPSGGLLGSTDGGVTFAAVPIAGPGLPPNLNVQVVAVDPTDAAHLLIAGNSEGFILESTDAGATWTVVNSPTTPGGRNFLSEGVGDLEFPPATAPLQRAAATGKTLVGTGGGLFAADFGLAPVGCTSVEQCDDGDACTTDACAASTCTHTAITGVEGVRCALDVAAGDGSCADAKLQRQLGKKLTKIGRSLDKYAASTKASKTQKLKASMQKQLAALARKVAKAKKSDADCKALLGAQLDAVRALVDAL